MAIPHHFIEYYVHFIQVIPNSITFLDQEDIIMQN